MNVLCGTIILKTIRCVVVGIQREYHNATIAIIFHIICLAFNAAQILIWYPLGASVNVWRTGVLIVCIGHIDVVLLEPAHIGVCHETIGPDSTIVRGRAANFRIQCIHQSIWTQQHIFNLKLKSWQQCWNYLNECPYVGRPMMILLLSRPCSCQ